MKNQFKNREDAAMQLAQALQKYKDRDGIVLAVPRGGVPIGYYIAKSLGFPLEIVLAKKIGHPHNPEFAIGSVSLHGTVINDSHQVDPAYIRTAGAGILEELRKKSRLYMGERKPSPLKNKTVIIADDGVATGSTIKATILAVRNEKPAAIVVAVPVAAPGIAAELRTMVDELICPLVPMHFHGVGQFYDDFSQVSDEQVIGLLEEIYTHSHKA